ncbi:MAG: HAMP domain-containing sensor histidine kinase [Erysipelotrichaceae bacterium]
MKRFRLWMRDLSLSQQLISIIFMVAAAFTIFFMSYLTSNLDTIINQQTYDIIERSQNSVIYIINQENYGSINEIESDVDHVIYNVTEQSIYALGTLNNVLPTLTQDTLANVVGQNAVQFELTDRVEDTLARAVKIDDENYLISYMDDGFKNEFKDEIYDSIINLNISVILILFAILMLWVASIIHPLNKITTYVSKISKGDDAILSIDRRDEIGEVAFAIKAMNDKIQQQERIKEEMIQNISHDLKTPIATIKSYGESINDGIFPYDTLEKSVDVIIEHAARLEKKVYSLIVLNRLGYLEDTSPEGDTLDMVEIINKVILSMQVVKEDINITPFLNPVKFHGEEEPWRIVVENLLENAIRYAKAEIVITLSENELEISNDGEFLTKDIQERMFSPYEKGTKGRFGLGLSIVHRICTTYGYHIAAENTTDGVLFRISKPKSTKKKLTTKPKNDEV